MKILLSILVLSTIFLISCGSNQLLEDGTYDVSFVVTKSDWGIQEGYSFENQFHLEEKDGIYTVFVGNNKDWYLEGIANDGIINLEHYQDLGDKEIETGICHDYNKLFIDLIPDQDKKEFIGTSISILHLCNLSPCGIGIPLPGCEPTEQYIREFHDMEGILKE